MFEGYFKKPRRRIRPEISMAPLIDMVFILLIFFLVSTTFTQETGVTVERPKAVTAEPLAKESILIGITEKGAIFFENQEVSPRDLRSVVRRALDERPGRGVIILADKSSKTGRVIEVLDVCKQAGAAKVSISSTVTE